MSSKVKSGLVLPVVIVAVVAAVALPEVRDRALDLFNGFTGGTELVGDGETQFMVAASAASDMHKCEPERQLADQRCDDLKFVIIDATRMPFIARNISTAREAGKPGVLTKDRAAEAVNRRKVCLPSFPRAHGAVR